MEQSDPGLFRNKTTIGTSVLVFWIFAVFLLFQVLQGPLRFVLDSLGLFVIVYLPKVAMLFAIPILITNRMRTSSGFVITSIVFGLSFAWGLINLGSIQQPLFGVWMFIPLIFSVLAAQEITLSDRKYLILFRILVWLSAGGVILNLFVNFPWSGASISFGGQNLVASRQWTSNGISRYGGFSSSFFASAQIIAFALYINAFSKSKFEVLLTWLIAGTAITITTSKGLVIGYILSSLYYLSVLLFSSFKKEANKYLRVAWSFVLVLIFAIMVVLPIAAINLSVELSFHSTLSKFLLESFSDRMTYMWPTSLGLLNGDWHWLVGRGIGGIGTAQQYFELPLYVTGDNLFVYLTVTFGVMLSFVMLLSTTFGICKSFISGKIHPLLFPFILVISTYGIFANIVEDPIAACILGLSIGVVVMNKRNVSELA